MSFELLKIVPQKNILTEQEMDYFNVNKKKFVFLLKIKKYKIIIIWTCASFNSKHLADQCVHRRWPKFFLEGAQTIGSAFKIYLKKFFNLQKLQNFKIFSNYN